VSRRANSNFILFKRQGLALLVTEEALRFTVTCWTVTSGCGCRSERGPFFPSVTVAVGH